MSADMPLSKRLSFWLRHRPDAAGLALDDAGWAEVTAVLAAFARAGLACDAARLARLVRESDKRRFELSDDGQRIRARQGHSVPVALGWPAAPPPPLLYPGTVEKFLPAIRAEGLRPMNRHHVHLSADTGTAANVGQRRGRPVILTIDAKAMAAAGHIFHLTANGVWLTLWVPPAFLGETGD
jgi:putative RNA 2'-phosphotransferase